MSAIASTVALGASARRAAAPAKRGDLAGKRAATIGDRLAKATEGIPKPNLPSLPKVNLPSAPKMPSIGGGKEASEGPGYTPARDGDTPYVGQGKYIKDDKAGIVSKTGRDSLYVGGFAGGEEGLQNYRDVLKEDPGAIAVAKKSGKKPRRESKEVDLSKDFGACAGGFPGGEVGLKAFNATGVVATRSAPPTIGWGPPVLLLLAIGGTGYYLNGGDMSVEGVQSSLSVESLDARLSAASSLASGAKGTLDANLAPEQEAVLGEVVLGGLGVIVALSLVKRAAKKEARYAIKWSSKKEQIFELPTGGAAIMRGGDNVMYFARTAQCLALGTQLRTFKITDYRIFRIFATGEVQFLHPKDGVFPEKSNEGRISVGKQEFSIGKSKAGWKDDGTGK